MQDILIRIIWPTIVALVGIVFSCGAYWVLFKNLTIAVTNNTNKINSHEKSIDKLNSEVNKLNEKCDLFTEKLTTEIIQISTTLKELLDEESLYKHCVRTTLGLFVKYVKHDKPNDTILTELIKESLQELDDLERALNKR